tara:strand:- start:415 stop:744 length:330 start_codon:yes stop_codon:yes gene_type:complete
MGVSKKPRVKTQKKTLKEFLLTEISKKRKIAISRAQLIQKASANHPSSTQQSVYQCLKKLVGNGLVKGKSPGGGTRGGYHHFCLPREKIVYTCKELQSGYKSEARLVSL